ncbi:hypothetical protein EYF80_002995 [Liparis tanakae]|uniref:Uncharacterized protein n=1 Tax=Liparis tanakae TaxID=230148 RepID=A0A4Z2JBW2_9TELE|nr:hypothetical protein EYF80_002995 [Liparis tanakae]
MGCKFSKERQGDAVAEYTSRRVLPVVVTQEKICHTDTGTAKDGTWFTVGAITAILQPEFHRGHWKQKELAGLGFKPISGFGTAAIITERGNNSSCHPPSRKVGRTSRPLAGMRAAPRATKRDANFRIIVVNNGNCLPPSLRSVCHPSGNASK